MFYPLLAYDYAEGGAKLGKSAIKTVLDDMSSSFTGGAFDSLGIAIASIFVLVVIFQGVTAILEGGKFQVKMLGPILIYICVCNFDIVAVPTKAFFTTLQESAAKQITGLDKNIYGGKSKLETFVDAYSKNNNAVLADIDEKLRAMKGDPEAKARSAAGGGGAISSGDSGTTAGSDGGSGDGLSQSQGWLAGLVTDVTTAIKDAVSWCESSFVAGFALNFEKLQRNSLRHMISAVGGPFLLATLIDWFVYLITLLITCMGGILTGVIFAFGPVTWAFAIVFGASKTISSWFIRLCQFALYSPICILVNHFSTVIFMSMIGGAQDSILGLCAVELCNLVLLTQVPTIAGQIIEGASGGFSLSQGVSTLVSPFRMVSDMTMMGEAKRDSEQMKVSKATLEAIKSIASKL